MGKYKENYIVLNFPSKLKNGNFYFEIMFTKVFDILLNKSMINYYIDKLIFYFKNKNYEYMDNFIEEIIKSQKQEVEEVENLNFYLTVEYYPSLSQMKKSNTNSLNFYKRLDIISFISSITPYIILEKDFLQININLYKSSPSEDILKRINFDYVIRKVYKNILNKEYIKKDKINNYPLEEQMKIYLFIKLYEYYKKK